MYTSKMGSTLVKTKKRTLVPADFFVNKLDRYADSAKSN